MPTYIITRTFIQRWNVTAVDITTAKANYESGTLVHEDDNIKCDPAPNPPVAAGRPVPAANPPATVQTVSPAPPTSEKPATPAPKMVINPKTGMEVPAESLTLPGQT